MGFVSVYAVCVYIGECTHWAGDTDTDEVDNKYIYIYIYVCLCVITRSRSIADGGRSTTNTTKRRDDDGRCDDNTHTTATGSQLTDSFRYAAEQLDRLVGYGLGRRAGNVCGVLASVSMCVIFGLRNGRTVELCGVCLLGGCLTANGQSVDGDGRAERAVASVARRCERRAARRVEGMALGTLAGARAVLRQRRRRRRMRVCAYRWQRMRSSPSAERRTPKDACRRWLSTTMRTLSTLVASVPIGVDLSSDILPCGSVWHADVDVCCNTGKSVPVFGGANTTPAKRTTWATVLKGYMRGCEWRNREIPKTLSANVFAGHL